MKGTNWKQGLVVWLSDYFNRQVGIDKKFSSKIAIGKEERGNREEKGDYFGGSSGK